MTPMQKITVQLLAPVVALVAVSAAATTQTLHAVLRGDSSVPDGDRGRDCGITIPPGMEANQELEANAVAMNSCGAITQISISSFQSGSTQSFPFNGSVQQCGLATKSQATLFQDAPNPGPECTAIPSSSWTGISECSATFSSKISTDAIHWGSCQSRKWIATASGT